MIEDIYKKYTQYILSFIVGSIIGILIVKNSDQYIRILSSIIAPFSGAFFAFKLNEINEKRKKKENNLIEINSLIFQLKTLNNTFKDFKKNQIDDRKTDKTYYYLEIPPTLLHENWKIEINFESFTFLFKINNGERLLFDINLFQSNLNTLRNIINLRNELMAGNIREISLKNNILDGTEISEINISEIFKPKILQEIKNYTDQMENFINALIMSSDYIIRYIKNLDL